MIDEIIMGKVKEGNESITQIEGTETPTTEVIKLVEKKVTERLHEEEDKTQRESKMIFLDEN